jgi:hypothetical protein
MQNATKGFAYVVSRKQIDEYRSWPLERRLKWLYWGNKLRKFLPRQTVAIQEAFRRGKI